MNTTDGCKKNKKRILKEWLLLIEDVEKRFEDTRRLRIRNIVTLTEIKNVEEGIMKSWYEAYPFSHNDYYHSAFGWDSDNYGYFKHLITEFIEEELIKAFNSKESRDEKFEYVIDNLNVIINNKIMAAIERDIETLSEKRKSVENMLLNK